MTDSEQHIIISDFKKYVDKKLVYINKNKLMSGNLKPTGKQYIIEFKLDKDIHDLHNDCISLF